jgi:hypothetical protein
MLLLPLLLLLSQADLAFSMAVRPCNLNADMDSSDDKNGSTDGNVTRHDWDPVREAFLRLFVTLLRGYHKYLVLPTKADPR